MQINTEELQLVLAMNRLRRAYLTIVATVDAAPAAAVVVLVLQVAEAARAAVMAGGAAAFLVVWGVLFRLQLHSLRQLRATMPRFPTPPASP